VAADWSRLLMPAFACGNRSPAHTKIGIDRSLAPDRRRELLGDLVGTAELLAVRDGLSSVSYLYVDVRDDDLRAVLDTAGYVAVPAEPTYSMEVPATFADYLARFSKTKRRQIRRDIEALRDAGVTFRRQPLTENLARRLAPLEAQLYARHDNPVAESELGAIMASIARNVGDHAEVVTARKGDELCGFVLVFHHGTELYARQAGFDYAIKRKLPVYFGLVYYELVHLAAERGLTRIYYSIGSGEAKVSRGCVGTEQVAYLKGLNLEAQQALWELARACR
jgi:predicted N-acyltransferase